ncbi:MAG: NPXTG-anchored protein, partial [Clostridia bacterium]|nr:NPXTG-anchored protein [Clostridia bacterium]
LSKLGDLGNIGDLFSGLNLEDLLGSIIPNNTPATTAAPDTTAAPPASTTAAPPASTTAAPPASTTAAPTSAPNNNIPRTGDAGIGVVVALSVAAGAAFVFTRKKHEA